MFNTVRLCDLIKHNMQTNISLKEIIEFLGSDIKTIHGNPEGIVVSKLSDPQNVDQSTLDWISDRRSDKQTLAEGSNARAIVVTSDVTYTESLRQQGKILVVVANPKMAIAKVGSHFFVNKPKPQIHPTAIIHAEAILGENVAIGPYSVVGKCVIGNKTYVEGNNYIYDNVIIKENVEIHTGAIIGSEDHNFVEDENGSRIKFPHLGGVVIEDNVLIGANSVISRGVLSDTIIGYNTKIARMVLIGANNNIGSNCAIRANVMISGSVKVGENTIIAPSATIREQRTIGKNCFVGMGAVVTKNIPDGETWIGNPAKPMKK